MPSAARRASRDEAENSGPPGRARGLQSPREAVYLSPADNCEGPLLYCLPGSISRLSARQTGFPYFAQPSEAACEHTSAVSHHDHLPTPCFRSSAAVATAAPERATPLVVTRRDP